MATERKISVLTDQERRAAGVTGAPNIEMMRIRSEIESWRDGSDDYSMAMWDAFDAFYNEGLFQEFRVAETRRNGRVFTPMRNGVEDMPPKEFVSACVNLASKQLKSGPVTDRIGHEMTDAEVARWGLDVMIGMRDNIVNPNDPISDDALRQRFAPAIAELELLSAKPAAAAERVKPVAPAESEPVSAEPVVSAEPESVVSTEPEPVFAEPVVSAEPEPVVSAEPEPASAEPVVSVEPEPASVEPVVSAEPEPASAGPVVSAEPEPASTEPDLASAEPVVSAEPEPASTEPVVSAEPEPASTEPVVSAEPKSTAPVSTEPEREDTGGGRGMEKREIQRCTDAERAEAGSVYATSESAKKFMSEIESWRDGDDDYSKAMWDAFDAFYNAELFDRYRVAYTRDNGKPFAGAQESIENMAPDDFKKLCVEKAGKALKSKAVTEKLGHEMTEDEIALWGANVVVALRHDIVNSRNPISDDALLKKLCPSELEKSPLPPKKKKEESRKPAEEEPDEQDEQDESDGDEKPKKKDKDDEPEHDDEDSDENQSDGSDDGEKKKKKKSKQQSDEQAEQQQPEQKGFVFGTQTGPSTAPVQGSSKFSQNMSQFQFLKDTGAISAERFNQFAIVETILDMQSREGKSYTSMLNMVNTLNAGDRSTRQTRRLAKEIRELHKDRVKLYENAEGLKNALIASLEQPVAADLAAEGYMPGRKTVLSGMRDRVRDGGVNAPAVAEADKVSDAGSRKPVGAKRFIGLIPFLRKKDAQGGIQAGLDEAIEKNKERKKAGRGASTDEVYDTFAETVSAEPEDGAPVPAKGLAGFVHAMGDRIKSAGEFVKSKLPFGKKPDGIDDGLEDPPELGSQEPELDSQEPGSQEPGPQEPSSQVPSSREPTAENDDEPDTPSQAPSAEQDDEPKQGFFQRVWQKFTGGGRGHDEISSEPPELVSTEPASAEEDDEVPLPSNEPVSVPPADAEHDDEPGSKEPANSEEEEYDDEADVNFGPMDAEVDESVISVESTDPDSIEPESTDPGSAEPVSVEPASTEPASAEPVSVEPVSAEPVSAEPVSTEPAAEKLESIPPEPQSEQPVYVGTSYFEQFAHLVSETTEIVGRVEDAEEIARKIARENAGVLKGMNGGTELAGELAQGSAEVAGEQFQVQRPMDRMSALRDKIDEQAAHDKPENILNGP